MSKTDIPWHEAINNGWRLGPDIIVAIGLVFIISIVHELGHLTLFVLTNQGGEAWIVFTWSQMYVMIPDIRQTTVVLVGAGGLLFTLPFLAVLKKSGWFVRSVIVCGVLYGVYEAMKFYLWSIGVMI